MSKYGIIISWAVLGQGGHGHVNTRSNEDIIQVFYSSTCIASRYKYIMQPLQNYLSMKVLRKLFTRDLNPDARRFSLLQSHQFLIQGRLGSVTTPWAFILPLEITYDCLYSVALYMHILLKHLL